MEDPISMDLRSISCKGIKCFNLFQKPSISAVVSVIDPSNPNGQQKKKTAVDSDGGENPEWTETFRFDLGGRDLAFALEIDLMVQGNLLLLLGERLVGKVHVPIADLLKEGSDGSVRHVSYRVEGTDGKPNGEIRFSYNINYPSAVTVPAGGYCPPPPYQLDPVVPSPAGSYYPPQDPVVPSTAADFYPPPGQQYPVNSSPATGFYHPRQHYPPVPSPASDFYPPSRHRELVNAFPAAGCSPPPRPYPSPVSNNYPPQCQQEPIVYYPSPATVVGNYPPPSAPLACCYPPPPPQNEGHGYRPEIWDRRPYG